MTGMRRARRQGVTLATMIPTPEKARALQLVDVSIAAPE